MNKYIKFLLVPIMLFGANSNNCYSMNDNNDNIDTARDNIHNLRLQFISIIRNCEYLVGESGVSSDFRFNFYHFVDNLTLHIRWLCESWNNNTSNNQLFVDTINKKLPSFVKKLNVNQSEQIGIQQLSHHLITEIYCHAIQFVNNITNKY